MKTRTKNTQQTHTRILTTKARRVRKHLRQHLEVIDEARGMSFTHLTANTYDVHSEAGIDLDTFMLWEMAAGKMDVATRFGTNSKNADAPPIATLSTEALEQFMKDNEAVCLHALASLQVAHEKPQFVVKELYPTGEAVSHISQTALAHLLVHIGEVGLPNIKNIEKVDAFTKITFRVNYTCAMLHNVGIPMHLAVFLSEKEGTYTIELLLALFLPEGIEELHKLFRFNDKIIVGEDHEELMEMDQHHDKTLINH